MRIFFILTLLFLPLDNVYGQFLDTVNIYYRINEFELNSFNKQKLDSLIREININSSKIIINGYTDFLGNKEYNRALSVNRAEKIRNYFLANGIDKGQISGCSGKGKLMPVNLPAIIKEGIPSHRKVEIIIEKIKSPGEENVFRNEIDNLKEGETLVLRNLNFLPGSHILRNESLPELQKLLDLLKQNPKLKIEIQGHICCEVGMPDGYDYDSKDYNLSHNRAKYVFDYLVQKGIDPKRLSYVGFGRKNPLIKEEKTEADKNKNRRVEIKIIEK